MNVLYIEDNLINIKLIKTYFEQQKKSVELRVATSGVAGIDMIREQVPSIILMDIELPDMNGKQVALLIKNDPAYSHIPIVAVTAVAMQDDIENAEAIFDHYLTKPINFIEFQKILDHFSP